MYTRAYAIFFNGILMGQADGHNAASAAAAWLATITNKNFFDRTEVEVTVTVGHYRNCRIERLTTHRFKRTNWVYVGVVPTENVDSDGEDNE